MAMCTGFRGPGNWCSILLLSALLKGPAQGLEKSVPSSSSFMIGFDQCEVFETNKLDSGRGSRFAGGGGGV